MTQSIRPKPGEFYRDCDPRVTKRIVKVVAVDGDYVHAEAVKTRRPTRIRVSQFHANTKLRRGFCITSAINREEA